MCGWLEELLKPALFSHHQRNGRSRNPEDQYIDQPVF